MESVTPIRLFDGNSPEQTKHASRESRMPQALKQSIHMKKHAESSIDSSLIQTLMHKICQNTEY
jgi:hypothetical protein